MKWYVVKAGERVPLQVEGGFVSKKAESPGVVFKTENGDAFFVPESTLRGMIKCIDLQNKPVRLAKGRSKRS